MITATVMYTTLIWGGVLFLGGILCAIFSDWDVWSGMIAAGALLISASVVMGVMEIISEVVA